MRDVVKTNVKREQSRKRKKRRKRHTMLYFFLVLFIVTGIGILLSVTLFFNVKAIIVEGDVDYTNESVIMTSGINDGDNLIRLDTEKVCETILSSMIYIETAKIDKQYPGTVVISVSGCIPTANLESNGNFVTVSERGKILENSKEKTEGLPVIKGVDMATDELGKYLDPVDNQKKDIIEELLKACRKYEKSKISEVDLSDIYDIKMVFDDRITFEMGNSNDMSYKVNLASTVLEKLDKNKHGIMTMVGTNQISLRENKGGANTSTDVENTEPDESPTEPAEESSNTHDRSENYIYGQSESSVSDNESSDDENSGDEDTYNEHNEDDYGNYEYDYEDEQYYDE